jgi:hypothetical protein
MRRKVASTAIAFRLVVLAVGVQDNAALAVRIASIKFELADSVAVQRISNHNNITSSALGLDGSLPIQAPFPPVAIEDIGFRSPVHRVAGRGNFKLDTTQAEKLWQYVPKWRDLPEIEELVDARQWVRARLDEWTRLVQDRRSMRTRHLFEWGPDRPVLAPLQSEGASSSGPAPSPAPPPAPDTEDDEDSEEEEDVEDNRNAFTECVEIGQDVEYIDGVDGADDQRIGERYGQVEVAIASEADLKEYKTDQGPRPKAVSHGDEYTYVDSTPHFHPRSVPYPRSRSRSHKGVVLAHDPRLPLRIRLAHRGPHASVHCGCDSVRRLDLLPRPEE